MKLRIKVRWKVDGESRNVEVSTTLATIVAWERQFRRKASDMGSGIGIEDILFLAWHQLSSLKMDGRDFESWMPDVEDVEVVESGDAGPPTKPDTSGDN